MIARPRPTGPGKADLDPARLIAACRSGDSGAWDDMVERYGRIVYSVPRRYGLCPADSDDVFQSVFITLFRRLDAIRDPSRLPGWLITAAHRECWRVGKRSGGFTDLEGRIDDLGAPAAEDITTWEEQDLVRVALQRLGGRCEALLTALFTVSGAPDYEAIAARLGIKVGSIGPTRARCFCKLERILLEMGVEPPSLPEIGEVGAETTGPTSSV